MGDVLSRWDKVEKERSGCQRQLDYGRQGPVILPYKRSVRRGVNVAQNATSRSTNVYYRDQHNQERMLTYMLLL